MTVAPTIGNRYQITRRLGSGAGGDVYVAMDLFESTEVAVKFLHPHPLGTWAEAQILRHLSDPHILSIRNADIYLGQQVLVTDVARNGTIGDLIDTAPGCGLPLHDVVRWIRHACQGVARAHQARLVHNDLKPANLFLTDNGECLVGDFGGASLIDPASGQAEVYFASPQTVAPEVASAWPNSCATVRSDVYSLGACAYWMLTGLPAFDPAGIPGPLVMSTAASATPSPLRDVAPHSPQSIATHVNRALARDPGDRFESATAFAAALAGTTSPNRHWIRTNEHSAHLGCWRGEPVGKGSTYLLCMTPSATAARRNIITVHLNSGRRVLNGVASTTTASWPKTIRELIKRLG